MEYKKLKSKTFHALIVCIISFILIVSNNNAFCNSTKTDSLKQLLYNSTNDSLSIQLNLLIGIQFETSNFDSALHYYNKALAISKRKNLINEQARVLINIGFSYFYSFQSDTSLVFLQQGLKLYQKVDNKKGQLDTYYNLGTFYNKFNKTSQAINSLKKAEDFGILLNDTQRLGMIYNNLGLIYQYSGQYDKANIYQFKALEIKEKNNDQTISITHINIGLNYLNQNNFYKSLDHYTLALNLFIKSNEKSNIALGYKNIGDVYLEMNDFEEAENNYNKAFEISAEINDENAIARHYMTMGNIYRKQNLSDKASENYKKALELFPENGSLKTKCSIYSNMAELELYLSQFSNKKTHLKNAISYAQLMNNIATELGSISLLNGSYNILYKTFKAQRNYKSSLKYAEMFIISKDSLFNKQKYNTIADIQTKYETEKKELEIEVLNHENELISYSLLQSKSLHKSQKTIIYLLISGFILVLVFVFVIYRFYFQTKRANQRLKAQNTIISKQKEEKEVLLKEVHHRVKNNLQIVSSLLQLQYNSIDNSSTKASLTDAQNRVKSIALIHQILHQNENNIHIKFYDFVSQLHSQITNSIMGNKEIKFTLNISKNINFDIETTIPLGLIINELITNSIKYAFDKIKEANISINIDKIENNRYKLEILDNGIGLPDNLDINTSKSLGLRLVRNLSQQISGKFDYNFETGSKFTIIFQADSFSNKITNE